MLHRPHPASRSLALHGRTATRDLEARWQARLPRMSLMQQAGRATAELARALAPHAAHAWVACGPGNNGGDGLVAAVHLHQAGLKVTVTWLGDPAHLPEDARAALNMAHGAGLQTSASLPEVTFQAQDIVIDALLGVGARSEPQGVMAACVHRLNEHPGVRLAVDIPSGMNADTGQPFGDCCVTASSTLSLLTLKPGLFTGSGRDLAGEVWLHRLGTSPDEVPADAHLAPSPRPSPRRHSHHKGSFGDTLVVGGATGMEGAAQLAARAALAAGAGRVHVDLLSDLDVAGDVTRPELMYRQGVSSGTVLNNATVVAGCGGGEAIASILPRLIAVAPRLVLDADALNQIAKDPLLQDALRQRDELGMHTVLTPHPLEAARLVGCDTPAVQADRLGTARKLADRFRCVVVLKGSGTVVAAPDEPPTINPTGNAALATAGTGDVLAGWLAGTWSSQALGARDSALLATWQHGDAADRCGRRLLRAGDLIEAMHTHL